jgi:hypothetical protein
VLLGACGGREVTTPELDAVPAPTFVSIPDDLADAPQLAAVPVRDTAGLTPTDASATTDLLPAALAELAALEPPPQELVRVSIYDGGVFLEWRDPTAAGRQISASYDGDGLYVSDPRFGEDEGFPVGLVDSDVPARLVEAIERRIPSAHVTGLDLRVALSYGFGLVWYVQLSDARGTLATLFAELDGAIVAVDAW